MEILLLRTALVLFIIFIVSALLDMADMDSSREALFTILAAVIGAGLAFLGQSYWSKKAASLGQAKLHMDLSNFYESLLKDTYTEKEKVVGWAEALEFTMQDAFKGIEIAKLDPKPLLNPHGLDEDDFDISLFDGGVNCVVHALEGFVKKILKDSVAYPEVHNRLEALLQSTIQFIDATESDDPEVVQIEYNSPEAFDLICKIHSDTELLDQTFTIQRSELEEAISHHQETVQFLKRLTLQNRNIYRQFVVKEPIQ